MGNSRPLILAIVGLLVFIGYLSFDSYLENQAELRAFRNSYGSVTLECHRGDIIQIQYKPSSSSIIIIDKTNRILGYLGYKNFNIEILNTEEIKNDFGIINWKAPHSAKWYFILYNEEKISSWEIGAKNKSRPSVWDNIELNQD